MPQKPYSVVGTLSAQVTYPRDEELAESELRALLARVGLSHLGVHEGMTQSVNWDDSKLSCRVAI